MSKVLLITGASRGIGAAIAKLAGARGYDVAVNYLRDAGSADEVVECAEKLGAGVAKALLGKSVLPDDLPFVTGPIGLLGSRASYELMENCDTLLLIGTSFPYSEWLPKEGQAKCVQIDLDGRRVGMRYPVDVPLVGDAKETLRALLPRLERKQDRSWREEVEEQVAEWWRVVEDLAMLDADPVNPQRVVWELSKRLPDDAIVTADSGSSTNWWACSRPRNTSSSMLTTTGTGTPFNIEDAVHTRRPCCSFLNFYLSTCSSRLSIP